MAGLVPAIHAFGLAIVKGVDARDKRGHDGRKGRHRVSATVAVGLRSLFPVRYSPASLSGLRWPSRRRSAASRSAM